MEYPELPLFERFTPAFERVLALLHVSGDRPQVVRIGGDSAEFRSAGVCRARRRGAYVLDRRWHATASSLIREAGWRVLMDLNLLRSTPGSSRPVPARLL